MMDKIKHRGPDAEGKYIDADIALGHRRLSIIDVSESGNQPLYSEDGNLVLVFNGEIYNYQNIRKKLVEAGYHFATQTDSEVLIYGYQEYGADLLNQLRGMFSFVIWDKRRKSCLAHETFSASNRFIMHRWAKVFVWIGNQKFPLPSAFSESSQRGCFGKLPDIPVLPLCRNILPGRLQTAAGTLFHL